MTPEVRDILKKLWKRGEQFLLFSTIFCYLLLDFHVKTRNRFSLRDKQLFEISEVEITRVDCISGPGCSKLTTSLVNDSLKFTSSDTQIC